MLCSLCVDTYYTNNMCMCTCVYTNIVVNNINMPILYAYILLCLYNVVYWCVSMMNYTVYTGLSEALCKLEVKLLFYTPSSLAKSPAPLPTTSSTNSHPKSTSNSAKGPAPLSPLCLWPTVTPKSTSNYAKNAAPLSTMSSPSDPRKTRNNSLQLCPKGKYFRV